MTTTIQPLDKALAISVHEKPGEFHHEALQQALRLISEAFADADEINAQSGTS